MSLHQWMAGRQGDLYTRYRIQYLILSSTPTVHVSIVQYLCTLTGSLRHAEHREPFRRSPEAKARCAVHLGLRAGRPQLKGQGLNGKIAAAGPWARGLWQIGCHKSDRAHAQTGWQRHSSCSAYGCSRLQHQRHHFAFQPLAPSSQPKLWQDLRCTTTSGGTTGQPRNMWMC